MRYLMKVKSFWKRINEERTDPSDEILVMSDKFYEKGFVVRMYLKGDSIIIMDMEKGDSILSGTDVMNEITNFADKNNLKIKLIAIDNYGTPLKTLISFYEKFGFEIIGNYHTGKEMLRYPFNI